MTDREIADARTRAAELILVADGAEEAGMPMYAHRARDVARTTVTLADSLESERSARRAVQEQRDRLMAQHFPGV